MRVQRAVIVTAFAFTAALSIACGPRAHAASNTAVPAGSQRQRVLLVSFDGFRWDYVDRPGAVHLRALAARGVRAERMIPAFPSKTFPNHYTIVTGLTPEHHGIVANSMRDARLGDFRIGSSPAVTDARWWGGEPIWVTAEKQGRRAASYFWPGSEAAIGGVRPTWYETFDASRPNAVRVRQVLHWLAMPPDSAPGFIAVYFGDTDEAGHEFGPGSPRTDVAIERVDAMAGRLVEGIDSLGLREVVNIIIVADHGMSQLSPDRVIVLDEYIDMNTIDVVDGSPVAALVPRDSNVERVYAALQGQHPHLRVYRKGEVPARLHFNDNPRITPIVAIADDGWTITTRRALAARGRASLIGGAHGYDPELPSMGAVFIAAGPGIAQGRVVPPFRNVHVYALMARLLGLRPAPNDGAVDSVSAVLRTPGASSP